MLLRLKSVIKSLVEGFREIDSAFAKLVTAGALRRQIDCGGASCALISVVLGRDYSSENVSRRLIGTWREQTANRTILLN